MTELGAADVGKAATAFVIALASASEDVEGGTLAIILESVAEFATALAIASEMGVENVESLSLFVEELSGTGAGNCPIAFAIASASAVEGEGGSGTVVVSAAGAVVAGTGATAISCAFSAVVAVVGGKNLTLLEVC